MPFSLHRAGIAHAWLFVADLEKLDLPYRYEAIIIPGGSLLLIQDRQASINVLRNLFQHLEPGGRLVFDLFLPDVTQPSSVETSTVSLPDGDTITVEVKTIEVNLLQQYKVSLIRYEQWHQGALVATEAATAYLALVRHRRVTPNSRTHWFL